ncbi:uncharacterized protein MKS88_000236 [Plasmodium brasilianum]|uniref:uncharacterized protein n=1 Tax=Plasmodium brasilianum TaxID=5824 RepID=UPI00350E3B14|nr:hypothetical protein MKS88_000236 [Plasmodium brasilianum]
MEQEIKTFLFKKISTLIFFCWICNIDTYSSTHNKSLNKLYSHRKLYARNYRILAKYKQDKDSCIVCLKEELPNMVYDKQDISNNEKDSLGKKNYSNESLPRSVRGLKKKMKNKSCIFETKKYSHLEKKIFKELDYVDFLQRNKTISDKLYKKIILKKFLLRIKYPCILLLLLCIGFIVEISSGYGVSSELYILLFDLIGKEKITAFRNACSGSFLEEMFKHVVVVKGIVIISWIVYYHNKVKNYERIKFRKK